MCIAIAAAESRHILCIPTHQLTDGLGQFESLGLCSLNIVRYSVQGNYFLDTFIGVLFERAMITIEGIKAAMFDSLIISSLFKIVW